jgi:hypothetical protein
MMHQKSELDNDKDKIFYIVLCLYINCFQQETFLYSSTRSHHGRLRMTHQKSLLEPNEPIPQPHSQFPSDPL